MMDEQLVALAREKAREYKLDEQLVCAIIEQESGWDQWAIRYEPAFMAKYVAPLYNKGSITATEAYARCFSWGLFQIMGQAARERGFDGKYLSALVDPATNLEWGLKHLTFKIAQAGGDIHKALLFWNGGGNAAYPDEVLARKVNYESSVQA
jgi:soluble lytic murein transglycosylase-like protein